jgi:hypothetical protein
MAMGWLRERFFFLFSVDNYRCQLQEISRIRLFLQVAYRNRDMTMTIVENHVAVPGPRD